MTATTFPDQQHETEQLHEVARKVVVVADDCALDRAIAARIIEQELKHPVVQVADGMQALDALGENEVLLVLTDLQMPELNGLELIEEAQGDYSHVPFVLMTAVGSETTAMEALQAGATSYVPKRELQSGLAETLSRVMALAKQRTRRQELMGFVSEIHCHLELNNDAANVPVFVNQWQEQLTAMQICSPSGQIQLGIALEESLLNGIHHGNLELSSKLRHDGGDSYEKLAQQRRFQDPWQQRTLSVDVTANREQAKFVIRDEGPGFDVASLPDPTDPENLLKPSGRGLLLIHTFMDEVHHNNTGNEITLVKRAPVSDR